MKRIIFFILVASWFCSDLAGASSYDIKPVTRNGPIAIVGGMLIDGNEGPPIHNSVIVVEGNRIIDAGTRVDVEIQPGASQSNAAPASEDTSVPKQATVTKPAQYEAHIRRTSYGVAHIEARDLGGIGFGEGYSQAEDHLCTIADQVVRVRSERAKYFGAGPGETHLNNDVGLLALNIYQRAAQDLAKAPARFRALYDGFAAGYNQYLEETGRENVAGWCQGQDWVFPITAQDIAAYQRSIVVLISRYASMIASAIPPQTPQNTPASTLAQISEAVGVLAEELAENGSNGWALGSGWTEGGNAMLVANPHYPWVGANRFWEKHLTIPGELNVYGVSLIGSPGIALGFNRHVGWTHTVSAGKRFTLYELELVPGKPDSYLLDGEEKSMRSQSVRVAVRQEDGSLQSQEHTVWFSQFGPIINFPEIGWSEQRVMSIRDANSDNDEIFQQWDAMSRAGSMDEFQAIHARFQGMPWTNTIAASAEGKAWIVDASATPYLSDEAIGEWNRLRHDDQSMVATFWNSGMVLLPGNRSLFEWQTHPDARDPGILPYSASPQLETRDYVFNANDSVWLANSAHLIAGDYSPLQGEQGTVRTLRTRNNDLTLSMRSPDQPAGDDQKFSLEEMADAINSNRSYSAELLKDSLLSACQERPQIELDDEKIELAEACEILANWNNRFDLESRGAPLFREWIGQYPYPDLLDESELFAVAFDPTDPVNTPRDLADPSIALQNLARAIKVLERAGLKPDVALGELQYAPSKTRKRIPIHGGNGHYDGVMNLQFNSLNQTTLEPLPQAKPIEGSQFLTEKGYPVVHGSSFVLALEYTDEGPQAKGILSYSQSGDPQSPHFTDQTELYSGKQWRPVLFEEAQISADTQREYSLRSDP